jgi:hypothetical protein
MAVHKHPTGGFRAYKKINNVEYQLYSSDEAEAQAMQRELEQMSREMKSLKARTVTSKCGRLKYLRIKQYKSTARPYFQIQMTINGKPKRVEALCKQTFELDWKRFFGLWLQYVGLSYLDTLDYKTEIKNAKRLYMQDVYNIEHTLP